jgi:hypothetical protein
MHENLQNLLNAYLDGELQGRRLQVMQTHLESCKTCQNELKELRLISNLLQTDPMLEFLPVERFVSQLTLRLPRPLVEPVPPHNPLRDRPMQSYSAAWWLMPAGLLGAWFFVQTVFSLTNLIIAMNMTGLLGQVDHWLVNGQVSLWFITLTSLSGELTTGMQTALSMLNNMTVFGTNLLSGFLWQAAIVLIYWGWLLTWFHRRGTQPVKV